VDDDIDEDRFGAKIGALLGGFQLDLAYYRTYSSIPVPFVDLAGFAPIDLSFADLAGIDPADPFGSILGDQKVSVVLSYDTVDVFGASFNYYLEGLDVVVRGETAYRKDVPKIIPGSVSDLIVGLGGKITLPIRDLTLADVLAGVDLGEIGDAVLPFSSGRIAKFDEWKFGLGLDKTMKIPALARDDFFFILEYVGGKILDYPERTIVLPWQGPQGEVLYEEEWSNIFVFIARTEYLSGNLIPSLVTMFEVESKALALIPSLEYQWRTWQLEVSYFHTISDSYVGFLGQLESRNEVSFAATFNF
jgi:hypothetical protein